MRDPKNLASKGRYGDTMLAHINPEEAALLKSRGGAGTINPKTGLPEFYWSVQQANKYLEEQNASRVAEATAAAKAKASAEKSAAASRVLTPEQRQANIARDLALSKTRGARPSGQDSQFYQPAYQPQYANYTNPLTAFNVSNYGTNPGMSKSMQAAMAPGAGGVDPYYKQLQSYANLLNSQGGRNNINTLMEDMQKYGISAQDLQNASSYNPQSQMQSPFNSSGGMGGGGGALTPEMARNLMQRSMMGGVPTSEFAKYGGYDAVQSLYDSSGGNYAKPAQLSTQPMQFNPYTNSPSYSGGMPQMQSPFSYQQPMRQQYQPQQQYNRFVDPSTGRATGLADIPQMMQPMQQLAQTNYGPSQAIVGRSSQMRGTPNVMRRAKGGIASLLKKHK